MRRLRRWAFNGAAALSAVLFVTTCVLWARARRFGDDRLIIQRGDWAYSFVSDGGLIRGAAIHYTWGHPAFPTKVEFRARASDDIDSFLKGSTETEIDLVDDPLTRWHPPLPSHWYCCFSADSGDVVVGAHMVGPNGLIPPDFRYHRASAHDWILSVSMALAPAMWLIRRIRVRRFRAGLCPACGYDLRATPNRCPECGGTPGAASSAVAKVK